MHRLDLFCIYCTILPSGWELSHENYKTSTELITRDKNAFYLCCFRNQKHFGRMKMIQNRKIRHRWHYIMSALLSHGKKNYISFILCAHLKEKCPHWLKLWYSHHYNLYHADQTRNWPSKLLEDCMQNTQRSGDLNSSSIQF